MDERDQKAMNKELNQPSCLDDSIRRLYYFDLNSRVYELNGVKKSSPFQEGYYRPIKIISETDKEFVCDYGKINKKTMLYDFARVKRKVYTEQEKIDDVYIQENRHILAEKVRLLSADVLRKVEDVLNSL